MKKLIALALVGYAWCGAQTLVHGPKAHAENFTTLKIVWTTSASTSATTVDYGLTTAYGNAPAAVYHRTTATAPAMFSHVAWIRSVLPGTTYHYRITINGSPVTGDMTFTTLTRPNVDIVRPNEPQVTVSRAFPAGAYNTDITVTNCSELSTEIANLANLTGSGHQRLFVQSGLECTGSFLWPARPNHSGWVIVLPTQHRVPPGVRFDPAKWSAADAGMFTLRNNYWNVKAYGAIAPTFRDMAAIATGAGATQSRNCQQNTAQGPGSYFHLNGIPATHTPLVMCSLFYPPYNAATRITEMAGGTNSNTDPVRIRVPGHEVQTGDLIILPSNGYVNAGTSGFPSWRYVKEVNGEWITLMNTARVSSNPMYSSQIHFTMVQHWKAANVTYQDTAPPEGGSCEEGQKIHVRGSTGEIWYCTDPTGFDGGIESGGSTAGVWRRFQYHTSSGNSSAIMSFVPGAARYRFIGINLTTTPLQNPHPPDLNYYYSPSVRNTTAFWYGSPAFNLTDVSDVIVDRSWIHKAGTANFDKAFQIVRATRLGIFENYAEGMEIRRPTTDPTYTQLDGTEGINFDSIVDAWIDNNVISGGTISIFSPASGNGPISQDVKITRNLIEKPRKWLLNTPEAMADGNGRYNNRGHFELKQGRRFLLEGNHFDFGLSNVNSGSFLMLTNRNLESSPQYSVVSYTGATRTMVLSSNSVIHSGDLVWVANMSGGLSGLYKVQTGCETATCATVVLEDGPDTDDTPIVAGTSNTSVVRIPSSTRTIEDLTVRYNLFTRGTETMNILGRDTNTSNNPISKATSRLSFHNNLLINLNAYPLNHATAPGFGTPGSLGSLTAVAGAKNWWHQGGVEELLIENNGTYGLRGGANRGLVIDGRGGMLVFRNNWWFQDWIGGGANNALIEATGYTATTALNSMHTVEGQRFWIAEKNVVCCNFPLTNYPSGWISLPSVQDFQLQQPSLTALDPRAYRFRQDSRFISGYQASAYCQSNPASCMRATGETDIGPNIDTLEIKLGKVRNARARSITSTEATISYLAPDSDACTVEYGTSAAWGTGIQVSDGGGDRVRNVNLTGLTAAQDYYYRVLCTVEQPSGTFRTE